MHAIVTTLAHVGHHDLSASGFAAGFAHPWFGLDHLLAMIAVGLLATLNPQRKALWLVPATFVAGMLSGGLLAWIGLPLPGVEHAIAASVITLGLAVAVWKRVALGPAIALVAIAGAFHGYAHIAEMTGHILAYAAGMSLGTAMLHAIGVAAGLAMMRLPTQLPMRLAGAAIVAIFAVTLLPI